MPWKKNFTTSTEKTLTEIKWKNSAQLAVNIVIDVNILAGSGGINNSCDPSFGLYSSLVEPWRLLDLLDKHNIKATFVYSAYMAERFKNCAREVVKRGHEIASGGLAREDVSQYTEEQERTALKESTDRIAQATGYKPHGWYALPRQVDDFGTGMLSPNSLELLLEEGFKYFGNGLADDIPYYWVLDFETRKNILSLPYYYHFDDQFFIQFPARGTFTENTDAFMTNLKCEFEASYKRGRQFFMTLHPYLIQTGIRFEKLEKFFDQMMLAPDLWVAPSIEIAEWWSQNYPAQTVLQDLKPSIWRELPNTMND